MRRRQQHALAVKLQQRNGNIGRDIRIGVVDERKSDCLAILRRNCRDGYRLEEAPHQIVHHLPAAAVIEARPRCHGPGVVELPVDGAHAMRLQRPPIFHRRLDREALLHLAQIDEVRKILREAEIAEHRAGDALVATGILLMQLHDRRGDIHILRLGIGLDDGQRGIGLETEFRAEARPHGPIIVEGLVLVPDRPVMHVARAIGMPGVAEIEIAGGRARRPPDRIRQCLLHCPLDRPVQAVVGDEIAIAIFAGFLKPGERAHQLIVAAPENDRGVRRKPANLIVHLFLDIIKEIARRRIEIAGEHEVLPHHQAKSIADVVEPVMLVEAAAPDADDVHIGINGRLQQIRRQLRLGT